MSIWKRIGLALSALVDGAPLSAVFDKLRTPPEQTVAFTIAVIALGAKMAKADGQVSRAEVSAFRRVFTIAPEEETHAARIFNLARQDVNGYEQYASRIARMFHDRPEVLADLLEGLFYIAMADGRYHPGEESFLADVHRIFGLPEAMFRSIKARHITDQNDPYVVLGVAPDIDDDSLRAHRRRLVQDLHPDRMIARGVPEEARLLAEQRLVKVNHAYEAILQERARAAV